MAEDDASDLVQTLQRQVSAMEEDFGKRRAQFKELFLAKEKQASEFLREHIASYEEEVNRLREQLRSSRSTTSAPPSAPQQQQQQQMQRFSPQLFSNVTKQLAKRLTGALQPEDEDDDVKRATMDRDILRSIVMPLEEEIAALKSSLRSVDSQLQLQLTAREQLQRADQLLTRVRSDTQLHQLSEELSQLAVSVSAAGEQGRPNDELVGQLLLYTSLLEAQKLAAKDDLQYARQTADELHIRLNRERAALQDARQTCRSSCDQLLETQRQHLSLTRRLRASLPADLLPLLENADTLTSAADATASGEQQLEPTSISSSRLSLAASEQTDGEVLHRGSCPSLNVACDLTANSLPGIARAPESSDELSLKSLGAAPGYRMVSEKEWSLLWDEVSVTKSISGRCDNCPSLEKQLQSSRSETAAAEKRCNQLQQVLNRHQLELEKELKYRRTTEASWKQESEQSEQLVFELSKALKESESKISALQNQYAEFVSGVQDRLRRLTADRHTVQQHLSSVEAENEMLLGKHAITSDELQNEFIDLPNNIEELHEIVLRYRDELISAKMARELADDRLTRQQLVADQMRETLAQEKDCINQQLSEENFTLKADLADLEQVRSELQTEQLCRHSSDQQLVSAREQFSQLNIQLDLRTSEKSALMKEVAGLKGKVSTLQCDLENSETVQRDFVKLSQSLQVELERIRQSETEVRWQHEEDVQACVRCNNRFSVTRRKHHCRHCGKIHCFDCLSKTVASGPNRTPSRVCDVCFTLLNRHSAPYFSSRVPTQFGT